MKTILILFNGKSLTAPKIHSLGYNALYNYFAKNNITLCRAPISYYDSQKKYFKKAQFLINNEWITKTNVVPDVIYDKSIYEISAINKQTRKLIEANNIFYNSLKLNKILSNKSLTFNFFKQFSATTILLNDPSDIKKVDQLKSSEIIIKPLSQSGGKGIFITKKAIAKTDIISNNLFPVLAQEFIDSSKVNNNFVKGCHDIRVIVRNNTPFYAFARIPQKNKRIANVSQGASLEVIPIENLLDNTAVHDFLDAIIELVEKIDTTKKLYAIDFIFDNDNNLWLIEMNSRPGLILAKSEASYQDEFYENLLTFFK